MGKNMKHKSIFLLLYLCMLLQACRNIDINYVRSPEISQLPVNSNIQETSLNILNTPSASKTPIRTPKILKSKYYLLEYDKGVDSDANMFHRVTLFNANHNVAYSFDYYLVPTIKDVGDDLIMISIEDDKDTNGSGYTTFFKPSQSLISKDFMNVVNISLEDLTVTCRVQNRSNLSDSQSYSLKRESMFDR